MVSLIQSNYRGMGSGLVPDGLGFMFQDRGEPFLSFGAMGGDMQPQGHGHVLTNLIDFDLNVQVAGDAARWRHYGGPEPTDDRAERTAAPGSPVIGTVEMASELDPDLKQELARRGYRIAEGTGSFGGYQAIRWDPRQRVYWGASEMRKDGQAIGY